MANSDQSPYSSSVIPGSMIVDTAGQQARVIAIDQVAGEVELQTADQAKLRVRQHQLASRAEGGYALPFAFSDVAAMASAQHHAFRSDQEVIPVIQEELQVGKRIIDTGKGVRVHKKIIERTEVVDEPLRQDQLDITHVPRNVTVDADHLPGARQEGDTLIVPVLEEVLVVERQWRLKEEIHITRHQREVHAPQSVVLKSQQVSIERFDEK